MSTPRYYTLAVGTHVAGTYWPYDISICFEGVERPVGFAEGTGMAAVGSTFTAQVALSEKWRDHFAKADGEWLLPYIEQLAAGIVPSMEELLKIATLRLKRAPSSYVLPVPPC
jgi:hypothetical protein